MRLFTMMLALSSLAAAQGVPPDFPNLPPGMKSRMEKARSKRAKDSGTDSPRVNPPGVPVALDSPPMTAFAQLEQHSVYHMRFTLSTTDPQMRQMMEQMGFAPMETTVSDGTKQVIMRMKWPAMDLPGQVDDWEFRSVSQNGRAAKLISSPAAPRLLKLSDAKLAQQLAMADMMAARSIAQSMASGPLGWVSAGVQAASTVLDNVVAADLRKKAHDFFKWQCVSGLRQETVDRSAPPLTDLQVIGDQTLEGVVVTSYEMYVKDKGQFHGPVRMHVAKDTGLPMRLEMSDPQMRGASMKMDYYDFDKGGEIEIPACLASEK